MPRDSNEPTSTPRQPQAEPGAAYVLPPGPPGVSRYLDQPGNISEPGGIAAALASFRARAAADAVAADWWADLEHVWRSSTRDRARRWLGRARAQRRARRSYLDADDAAAAARAGSLALYADARARGLAMSRTARLSTCRQRWVSFACGCQKVSRPVGCDQVWLCDYCRAAHYRRWRRRATRALRAHERAAMATWRARGCPKGGQPRAVLLTLTVAHSGDVARDRADLGRGWKRFYDHLRGALGGAFPFLLTWEVTEGADGLGHVHAHVVMLAPFFDWSEAASAWRRACPRSTHVNMRSTNAKAAAKYVSKYVTKGVQVGEMAGALAGHVLASQYGKRKVTTSRHFWRPVSGRGPSCCRRCAAAWRIVERPKSLTLTAPEPVWFALAELHRVALPRGPTQASLSGVLRRGVG